MLFFREGIPCPLFYAETPPPRILNDVLDLVDAGGSGPSTLAILPPDNFAATVTDEESGDENDTDMARLPGSVLRAEIVGLDNTSSEDDDDGEPAKKVTKSSTKWKKRDLKTKLPPSEWLADEQDESFLTPAEAFEKFFDDDVIALLVEETNRYAEQKNRSLGVTEEEMKCVLGVLLLSGYVPVPRRRMLWEISEDCHNELVANSMRRNRFEAIFSNLHVADNNSLPQNDRFAKMRPLFNLLNQKFLLYAPLMECYSIDESMCEYFGKHGCKQFMKGKPIRFGYKLWCLCTPLGYLVSTEPYQGKYGVATDSKNDLGLGGSVVVDMVGRLKTKTDLCFHVFFDNFFTSLKLARKLTTLGVKCTGTVRENRIEKCPLLAQKSMKGKERGTFDYRVDCDTEVIVCRWVDNSVVTVVSNAHGVEPTQQVKRYSREKKAKVAVNQPLLIAKYNANMGGVDRMDQNISKYRTAIRGKKWYSSLFTYLLDASVNNALQLYKLKNGNIEHLSFRRSIAMAYLKRYGCKPSRGKARQSAIQAESRFDRTDHIVIPQVKQTRCAHCHEKTTTRCEKCNVGVHVKCFKVYHART